MTTPCGTTERSIRSTAGMCGQECAKPGCVSRSAWRRPSRCSSRGAMCACGAASRRCTEWRRPKRRRPSPHVLPASPKKRALGWRTSLSGLAHLCTRLSRYPMLVGEHRCPRPKTKGAPGKSGPAIFALKISEDRCSRASPKQICPQNQNPQNGHLMARFDWGLGAVCFGANPVAAVFESAPGSATPPEHRIHFKPTSQEALLKQDISTLLGIGHFYFALTGHPRVARHGSEGTVAEGAASRTNSGRALYNQALAGGPEVSRPDYTARELVTQTARCERISHTRLKHSFSAACGNCANFCDANWLYTHTGWRRGHTVERADGQCRRPLLHFRYSTAAGQFRPFGSGSD